VDFEPRNEQVDAIEDPGNSPRGTFLMHQKTLSTRAV